MEKEEYLQEVSDLISGVKDFFEISEKRILEMTEKDLINPSRKISESDGEIFVREMSDREKKYFSLYVACKEKICRIEKDIENDTIPDVIQAQELLKSLTLEKFASKTALYSVIYSVSSDFEEIDFSEFRLHIRSNFVIAKNKKKISSQPREVRVYG